jgi:hypothetical protein
VLSIEIADNGCVQQPLIAPDVVVEAQTHTSNPGAGERIYSLMLGYGVDGWVKLTDKVCC